MSKIDDLQRYFSFGGSKFTGDGTMIGSGFFRFSLYSSSLETSVSVFISSLSSSDSFYFSIPLFTSSISLLRIIASVLRTEFSPLISLFSF